MFIGKLRAMAAFAGMVAALTAYATPAIAVPVAYDIGTVIFGVGPQPGGPIGSGQLTGTFVFDDATNVVTLPNFVASGTTGQGGSSDSSLDGTYNVLTSFAVDLTFPASGIMTVFRSSDGSTPVGVATLDISSLINPLMLPFPTPSFTVGPVSLGSCLLFFGNPCGSISNTNTSSGGATTAGPGVGVVPLPAALPLFAGGLGLMGLLAWRRKKVSAA